MKQFLRYQVSGMVFIVWLVVFYYSGDSLNIEDFFEKIIGGDFFKNKVFYGFIVALPIGVILHQLSVNIKNHIGVGLCKELDDFPERRYIEMLIKTKETDKKEIDKTEYIKYILERISNLNSFYYVRFDNGFLSPFLALIIIIGSGHSVSPIAVSIALGLGWAIFYYISRICKELREYYSMLDKEIS